MGNSELPAAGWYPAAHANGEARWWDGTRWFDDDQAATEALDATALTAPRRGRKPRTEADPSQPPASMRRRTGVIFTGSALVAGLLLGAGAGGAGSLEERDTLKAQITALEVAVSDAETASESAEDDADAAREDLADVQASASTAEQKLTAAAAQVEALEAAAATAQAELDARAAEIADLKTKIPAPAEPVQSAPVQDTTPSQNVSYANCTEARNAGAAPVRRGDPGYSSRLDRDGDGVGCE